MIKYAKKYSQRELPGVLTIPLCAYFSSFPRTQSVFLHDNALIVILRGELELNSSGLV